MTTRTARPFVLSARPNDEAHVSSNVILMDDNGATFERKYVGMTPAQAIADFITLIEYDGSTVVTTVTCETDTDCFFPTYVDYTEDQCVLCFPESF